jgi:hypothetical protein
MLVMLLKSAMFHRRQGGAAMAIFQVQLWPDGEWTDQPFQAVEASSAWEAAEKLYGRPLQKIGLMSQLRARVRDPDAPPGGLAKVFFEVSAQSGQRRVPRPESVPLSSLSAARMALPSAAPARQGSRRPPARRSKSRPASA